MKKLITLIRRLFDRSEKRARKIEEFRAAASAITSLEEACDRYSYAEKCGSEVAEIFENRIDELMIARITESKTTDDLEGLRKIYPFRETEQSIPVAKLFIERYTELSTTSEQAFEAFIMARKWSNRLNLDASIQEGANRKLDELILQELALTTTASAVKDLFLRARPDSEPWKISAQRWISLCRSLDEAKDLINYSNNFGELSNAAFLHGLAVEYNIAQSLSDPFDASDMLDALDENSRIRQTVIDRWDEISFGLIEKAESKDQIIEAFETSRDRSEPEMLAIKKMAKLLFPVTD